MSETPAPNLDKYIQELNVVEELIRIAAYLEAKGLRKLEVTGKENSRVVVELDVNTGTVFKDRLNEIWLGHR